MATVSSFNRRRSAQAMPPKEKRMTYDEVMNPPMSLLVKLGSLAVHVEEMLSAKGHDYDRNAIQTLLDDPEVKEWLAAMDKMSFLPKKS